MCVPIQAMQSPEITQQFQKTNPLKPSLLHTQDDRLGGARLRSYCVVGDRAAIALGNSSKKRGQVRSVIFSNLAISPGLSGVKRAIAFRYNRDHLQHLSP
jgi:hypothetical protein